MVSCISNDDIKLIFYISSRYNSQVPKYIKKYINFACIILIYLERLWDIFKTLTFHLQKYPTMTINIILPTMTINIILPTMTINIYCPQYKHIEYSN